MDEKQATAASYIINFFQEANDLTHNYGIYLNIMLELKELYENIDYERLKEHHKDILVQHVQKLRLNAHKCQVQMQVISKQFKINIDDKAEEKYKIMKETFIIPIKAVEEYVLMINTFLSQNIMKDLISYSNNMISKVYDDG